MPSFAINHMTAPRLRCDALFALAQSLGCIGVELRNDLGRPLFDGDAPATVRRKAQERGLRIVGLSQVYPFNDWSDALRCEVAALVDAAVAVGAETISLIPRNDGKGREEGARRANLRTALREILPMLEDANMVALVEPLGFESSSLRSKAETVEAIETLGAAGRFMLVHDTFHHHLAGGGPLFPDHTGIVHISGVADARLAAADMRDAHRGLVDADDVLGNVAQLVTLREAGYAGPVSIEAFSPEVHALGDIATPLAAMIGHIDAQMAAADAA
jgi:2-keto-myo-inositol isomerase